MTPSSADRGPGAASSPRRTPRASAAQADSGSAEALGVARAEFIEEVRRETPGTDLPRYVAVLDALLAWTAERADRLTLDPIARRSRLIRFARAGTKTPFWSAQPSRTGAPTLEVHLVSSRPSSAEDRAEALRTLNAHSRVALEDGDRLRIGFGALKNAAALAAVLTLLERLLDDARPPADG